MIVFASLKWDEIRGDTPLGAWFAYYIIIGHPCLMCLLCMIIGVALCIVSVD